MAMCLIHKNAQFIVFFVDLYPTIWETISLQTVTRADVTTALLEGAQARFGQSLEMVLLGRGLACLNW